MYLFSKHLANLLKLHGLVKKCNSGNLTLTFTDVLADDPVEAR